MATQDVLAGLDISEAEADTADPAEPASIAIPARWQTVDLGSIAAVHYGRARPRDDGPFPVIGSGGIYGSSPEPITTGETLVIGRKGAAGTVFYCPEPCYPSDTAFYLTWKQEMCVPFLYFSLLNRGFTSDNSIIPGLPRGDVENFQLHLPPPPEQRAIARALRSVQAAIQARRRAVALERERKAALMQHLFTHGTRGEATRLTEIGEMPESWRVVRLGEVCAVRYGLGQPPELDDTGVPMVRATDIKAGRIVSEGVLRVRRDAIPLAKNPYLNTGDIIVVRSGAYTGDVAMYDGQWEAAIVGYDLVASPQQECVVPYFLAGWLLAPTVQTYFLSQRARSAQPHLNAQQLSDTPLLVPTVDEQREIANVLSACNTKVATLQSESDLLDELFRALLEALMTGRLSALPLVDAEMAVDTPTAMEGEASA